MKRADPIAAAALALCVVPTTFAVSAAQAQEPTDTIAPIPVEPITVTVLRTPLELTEAPYAVAVKREAELRVGMAGRGLDESLRGIPGVQVDNRYNDALGERISVRGFGARAQFGVRGVKLVVDGIPATMADGQTSLTHVDPRDLGRVEVMRGPAAAQYGNAAGGVIRLQTASPPPVPVRQQFSAVAGQDGMQRLTSVTGGRTGSAHYRLDVTRFSIDGHREFSAAEKTWANLRSGYDGQWGELDVVGHFVDYDAQNPGSLSAEQLAEDRTQANGFNVTQRTGETARQGQIGIRWRRDLGGAGTVEASAYGLSRELENPIPPAIIDLERRAAGVRALYRVGLSAAGRTLEWSLGAEADLQRDDRLNFENDAGERGARTLDQFERVRSTGAFTQLAAPLAAGFDVLAALRYDRFRFSVDDRFLEAGDPDDSGHRVMDAVSPSVGLRYSVLDGLNVYGNAATAFETPTTTELVNRPSGAGGFNAELEPQRTRSFELGAKGRLGGRVAWDIAAYRAAVDDALIPFQVPEVEGRQFFRNAGSAVHRGAEVGASLRLAPGLSARLAYTFTDARFDSYAMEEATYDGNRLPGVAPHRVDGILTYRSADDWFVDLETQYSAAMPVDDANSASSPAYTVVDLRAGLDAVPVAGAAVAPFVGITDLFDAEYNSSVTVNAFGGRYYEPAPGRRIYGGLQVRFGAD